MKYLIVALAVADMALSQPAKVPAPLCSGIDCIEVSFLYEGYSAYVYQDAKGWHVELSGVC